MEEHAGAVLAKRFLLLEMIGSVNKLTVSESHSGAAPPSAQIPREAHGASLLGDGAVR